MRDPRRAIRLASERVRLGSDSILMMDENRIQHHYMGASALNVADTAQDVS